MPNIYKRHVVVGHNLSPVIEKPKVYRSPEEEDNARQEAEFEASQYIAEARNNAAAIIEDAKQRAANMIAEAEASVKQIHDDAYEEGYSTGQHFGLDSIEQQRADLLRDAEFVLNEAQEERNKIIADSEKEIIALTLAIARKVINHEITINQDAYLDLIRAAIKALQDKEGVNIKINATQYQRFVGTPTVTLKTEKGETEVTVTPESTFEEGDIIVRTPNGVADSGVNTQIDSIERAFLGADE